MTSTAPKRPTILLQTTIPYVTTTLGTSEITPATAAPAIASPFSSIPKTQILPIELVPQLSTDAIIVPPFHQKQTILRLQVGVLMNTLSLILSWVPLVTMLLLFIGQYYLWINYSRYHTHLFDRTMAKRSSIAAWCFLVLWTVAQILSTMMLVTVVIIIIIAVAVN